MSTEPLQDEKHSELLKHIDRLEQLGQKWIGSLGRTQSGNATIEVHAGSIGVWIAVTCCITMFVVGMAMAVLGGLAYTSTQQRLDRMQDYLNAIYMQAPQLKPKEQDSGNQKH